MLNIFVCFMFSQAWQDLAIDLRGDTFKWRWETSFIGPRQSADVLSKHLIMPLLCSAKLAFVMRNSLGEIPKHDLEQVSKFLHDPVQPRFSLARG
jgi:hypothetical protein